MTSGSSRRRWFRHALVVASLCIASLLGNRVQAQVVQGVVGGVSIDAEGVVQAASAVDQTQELARLRQSVAGPKGALAQPSELRRVSLKRLQQAILEARSSGQPLPEEMLFLAGLQRIEYVFVYPEHQDIVIAGPAEGWNVRQDASVVGQQSNRPVVRLEDIVTAFRTVEAARQQPISVSIDPTPEGSVRLENFLKQFPVVRQGFNASALEPGMREAFGPQQVKFTTVSTDTRMAQTLVAADYRMKLLAMHLESSPVAGLPSYLELIRNAPASKTQPRWWIACDYDAILHSDDKLAWQLDGRGVKAMTEEEFIDKAGNRAAANRVNKLAQKWADAFTAKFDELCTHNTSFGELRNVIDMNVVATVIAAHHLDEAAGCDLSVLRGTAGDLENGGRTPPKTIPPHCSFLKSMNGWVVSASGGVEINAWQIVAQQSQASSKLATQRTAAPANDAWWWD
jgi:hypothetical protein